MKFSKSFFALLALVLSACSMNVDTGGGNKPVDPSKDPTVQPTPSKDPTKDSTISPTPTPSVKPDPTVSPEPTLTVPVTNARMQDTPILHCWNWSMTNISNNLANIKAAGFKTIQLSPMQVQKDYYNGDKVKNGWWKLYQPLSFSIASGNNQNALGTKDQLKNLCSKAKSLGIDVIVDVVSNHLAGGSKTSLNGAVAQYEKEIANQNLIHNLGTWAKDDNLQSIVQGNIGDYPDLKTESTVVQNRVLSLLKEYIDCGINGFRFDAAKHIETPDDGTYASNYWPTILNGASNYAKSKSLDEPFYYGEILYTCGNGRSFSSYTRYMSVIDSNQGSTFLNAVKNKSLSNIKATYNSGVKPEKLVLWAESHDTYANDNRETTDIDQGIINKAYVIQTSRKDAATLYFARPNSLTGSTLGDVGTTSYQNSEIKAINNFHNQFLGEDESISTDAGCFVNVRGKHGAAIVNIANSNNTVTVKVPGLIDGSYTDLVSSKKYTVSNGSVTVGFTNGTCVLSSSIAPTVELSTSKEIYSGTNTINVSVKDATSTTYKINNGTAQTLSGKSITLDSSIPNGVVTITVTATNKYGTTSKSISLFKTDKLINSSIIIYNIDSAYPYYCWSWAGSSNGQWYTPTMEGNAMGFNIGSNDKFIIVKMKKGATAPDWDNKEEQTEDMTVNGKLYNYNDLPIK